MRSVKLLAHLEEVLVLLVFLRVAGDGFEEA